MKAGLNLTITIFRRVQEPDDTIGGARQHLSPVQSNLPARITKIRTPTILKAQGIVNEDTFMCAVETVNYTPVNIRQDDVVVPDSGQYKGFQFMVSEIEDTSLDDNPVDYRGLHKGLTLRKIEPKQSVT